MYASRKIIKAVYRTLKLNHGFFIILSMLKRIQSVEITLSYIYQNVLRTRIQVAVAFYAEKFWGMASG